MIHRKMQLLHLEGLAFRHDSQGIPHALNLHFVVMVFIIHMHVRNNNLVTDIFRIRQICFVTGIGFVHATNEVDHVKYFAEGGAEERDDRIVEDGLKQMKEEYEAHNPDYTGVYKEKK